MSKSKRITVRLDTELWQQLHWRMIIEGIPMSELIRRDVSAATQAWVPPVPSTSGLSLQWPADPVSRPCVTTPDTGTTVTHTQLVEKTDLSPEVPSVCQPPLKGGL